MSSCCPVVELRQYTLRHGQRDVLIELFDREFIESQEAVGMEVIGQFRDLDRPERFVWMRGFQDMQRRREALEAFYGGPVWKAHAAAANATMVDVDDVLLLRPVAPSTGFEPQPQRPGQGRDVAAANFAGDRLFAHRAGGPRRADAHAAPSARRDDAPVVGDVRRGTE